MNQDEQISLFRDTFNGIVDKLIPASETAFIAILKEKLNPLSKINKDSDITDVYRYINELRDDSLLNYSIISTVTYPLSMYKEWYKQIGILFVISILDQVVNDDDFRVNDKLAKFKFITTTIDDFIDSSNIGEGELGIIEKLKKIIARRQEAASLQIDLPITKYYFDLDELRIKLLYDFLIENNFIKDNQFFVQSFSLNNKNAEIKTQWIRSQRELFVLLFLLNNNGFKTNSISIAILSDQLFYIKRNQFNNSNAKSNLSKISKDIQTNTFLTRNYPVLLEGITNLLAGSK